MFDAHLLKVCFLLSCRRCHLLHGCLGSQIDHLEPAVIWQGYNQALLSVHSRNVDVNGRTLRLSCPNELHILVYHKIVRERAKYVAEAGRVMLVLQWKSGHLCPCPFFILKYVLVQWRMIYLNAWWSVLESSLISDLSVSLIQNEDCLLAYYDYISLLRDLI